jgi:alkaline phosphatase
MLCAALAGCSSSSPALSAAPQPARPKSIIFLIADGSGAAHFTVARMIRGESFHVGRMTTTGLVATSPVADSRVTDSAAAATAYATGHQTKYRAVGVDAQGQPRETLLEIAEKLGKSTGLVTTTHFFDATPAAFAAHTPSRYEADLIVRQMLGSGAEVIIGGGLARFGVDGRPTIEEVASSSGYTLARTLPDLRAAAGNRLLGVFTTQKHEADFPEARLPELARIALDRVSRDGDGFFLMIEHEGTDGASHAKETEAFIKSMVSFDEAVGVALDYAATRNDVLVVVTGDHETGGLQIHGEKEQELRLAWATGSHTGEALPVFSIGPGANTLTGFMSGDELGRRLQSLWK